MTSPCSGGMPSRLGISLRMISRTSPNTKPVTIGRDMNSAAQPSFSSPPMIRPTPAESARAEVIATARSGSCRRGPQPAIRTGPTRDTGPTTRRGDDPNRAYAIKASGIEYNLTSTGTPAIAAVTQGLRHRQGSNHQSGQEIRAQIADR